MLEEQKNDQEYGLFVRMVKLACRGGWESRCPASEGHRLEETPALGGTATGRDIYEAGLPTTASRECHCIVTIVASIS